MTQTQSTPTAPAYDPAAFTDVQTLYGETSEKRANELGKALFGAVGSATDAQGAKDALKGAARKWSLETIFNLPDSGPTEGSVEYKQAVEDLIESSTGMSSRLLDRIIKNDSYTIDDVYRAAKTAGKALKRYALNNIRRAFEGTQYSIEQLKAYGNDLATQLGATASAEELGLKTKKDEVIRFTLGLLAKVMDQDEEKAQRAKGVSGLSLDELLGQEA